MGVKADDVVREQPVVDRAPDPLGQHAPEVGLRPRDVHEVAERGVGPGVADEPRREIQVIVVEEDRCVGLGVELVQDRVGERSVHRDVPVVPGVMEPRADVRRVRERPQVVLQEPERRVRDDVVEPVVRGRVVRDEPQPVRRAVARHLLDRVAAGLLRDRPVLVGHRARDPRHVVVRDQAPERSDEPAASTSRQAVPVLVTRERHRAAVGDDDQLPAERHRRGDYVTRPPRFRARSRRDRSRPAG